MSAIGHRILLTLPPTLALMSVLAGCQSNATKEETQCKPAKGMTTTELANCGCFSANKQSRYSIVQSPEKDGQPVQSVSILSYFCPVGTKGFARVIVVNGVAKEVFE